MAKLRGPSTRHYVVFEGEFVWIPIAKVASTSMRRAWGRDPRDPRSWEDLTDDERSLEIRAFVRHPLDRMVSGFADVFGRIRPQKIEQHVDTMLRMDPHAINRHIRPQWCFFKAEPDFLGRFETLTKDWSKLMKRDPKMKPLKHTRQSNHWNWQDLPERLLDKAREVYRGDFEKFGYQE